MVYCIVPFCKSNSRRDKISFHEIPTNPVLRRKWLAVISREGESKGSHWIPNQFSSVCAKHFMKDDFKPTASRKVLKPNVVPTVFPEYPLYMQPKKVAERRIVKRQKTKHTAVRLDDVSAVSNSAIMSLAEISSMQEPLKPSSSSCCTEGAVLKNTIDSNEKKLKSFKLTKLNRKCRNLKSMVSKMRKEIKQLKCENRKLKDETEKCLQQSKVHEIQQLAYEGNTKAIFLIDQITLFEKLKPRWSETTIRYCILWQSRSPSGYRYIRNLGLLKLPSESTLKKYLGYGLSDTGFSSLVKQRLELEKKHASDISLLGSVIIDEMAIKPMLSYDKMRDKLIGTVDMDGNEIPQHGAVIQLGLEKKLAKHFLCFMFSSVCGSFKMPVAYYFTLKLTREQLYDLTLKVLKELDASGFLVCRIVTDNLAVNTAMFQKLCNVKKLEDIKYEILHPFSPERKLFLSYDYCHVIKNIRNQFLSNKKCLTINGTAVSSCYVRQLYELSTKEVIKPVRNLTSKHINPSGFEKMNVRRALDIFAPEVTAALKFLSSSNSYFQNANETVKFMEKIHKWFVIHNVHNKTQHIHQNLPDSMHFFSVEDERLAWLEDFVSDLKQWRRSCKNVKVECLSRETFYAAILTTLSTVNCVKYLLSNGVQYVLTNKFSSDAVESFFGFIRQIGGRNDMCNALSVTNGMSKIIKTGIIAKDTIHTISEIRSISLPLVSNVIVKNDNANIINTMKDLLQSDLFLLEQVSYPSRATLQVATVAFLAGYLVRTVCDNIVCAECPTLISTNVSPSPCNAIIESLDRGGLKYPKLAFITVIDMLNKCTKKIFDNVNLKNNVVSLLSDLYSPHLCKNPMFHCRTDTTSKHVESLCTLILSKFLRPFVTNYGYKCTDEEKSKTKYLKKKPLNRKILKVGQK